MSLLRFQRLSRLRAVLEGIAARIPSRVREHLRELHGKLLVALHFLSLGFQRRAQSVSSAPAPSSVAAVLTSHRRAPPPPETVTERSTLPGHVVHSSPREAVLISRGVSHASGDEPTDSLPAMASEQPHSTDMPSPPVLPPLWLKAWRSAEASIVGDVHHRPPTSVDVYAEAAVLDNPSAMANLGVCFWQGRGVARDEQAAIDLFAVATRAGNSDARRYIQLALPDVAHAAVTEQDGVIALNADATLRSDLRARERLRLALRDTPAP